MSRYDYDRDYDRESCGGAASGCAGCDECVKEVRHTSYHTARREHHGLLPGDRYARTTGFDYQINGKRTGYATPRVARVGFGPLHAPVLVGVGFDAPTFAMPPVAQERAALAARLAEVSDKVGVGVGAWARVANSVEEADALVVQARRVVFEVEAFVAAHDADGKLNLRARMGATNTVVVVVCAERRAVEARKREEARKAADARKVLTAEWQASGGSWKDAGTRVTFQGAEYVLGTRWSRWVAHSNMEYMGESVDGEVLCGRSLLCPETGKVLLRWTDKQGFPA